MKTTLHTISTGMLAILCISCTSYQYFTMSSELQPQPDNSFMIETETASVNYKFSGDGQLTIVIFNNSENLIFIDWEKSSLLLDQESIPFPYNESYFQGTSQLNYYNEINFEGTIHDNIKRRYIPPQSYVSETISLNFIDAIDRNNYNKASNNFKYFEFTRENTPFAFDSYLYINSIDESQPLTLHQEFWASGLLVTADANLPTKHNQFSKMDVNEAGAGMGVFLLGGAVIYLASTVDWDEVE
ncbi:MAG: hypothetical protein RIC35_08520 [Marinoscillum sp.]